MMNKLLYYILSLSWGLPMTLVGIIVSLTLILLGYKPKKFGWCWYFEVGSGWGGLELGLVFLCSKDANERTKAHEFGHSIQNCYWGILMPFVISIPSAIRYWWREYQMACGKIKLQPYDAIWFEGQATQIGLEYIAKIEKGNKNKAI